MRRAVEGETQSGRDVFTPAPGSVEAALAINLDLTVSSGSIPNSPLFSAWAMRSSERWDLGRLIAHPRRRAPLQPQLLLESPAPVIQPGFHGARRKVEDFSDLADR